MLNPKHERRVVERPLLLRPVEPTTQDVLASLRELRQPITENGRALLADRSAAFAVEEFARQHMSVRDELAWKAARGLSLTETERAALHALNHVLDEIEPPPAPLSPEAQRVLLDTLRHLGPSNGTT